MTVLHVRSASAPTFCRRCADAARHTVRVADRPIDLWSRAERVCLSCGEFFAYSEGLDPQRHYCPSCLASLRGVPHQ